jgi:tetratricopeptide (TPR) repeat protein
MKPNNIARGIQLFELGKYEKSIQYFKDALAKNVNDFEAKYYLAFSLLCLKKFKESEDILLNLLNNNAENEYVVFLLAKNKYFSKNIKEAEKLINTAIGINPNEADFFGIKAYIYIAKKEHENAIKTAKVGLKINAENKLCLNALINETGKVKEENSDNMNNLLHLDPNDAFSQANIGFSKLRKHNYEEAKAHFKIALSLDPNLKLAKDGMLAYLKLKGNYLNFIFGIPLIISKFTSKNPLNLIFGFFVFIFIYSQFYYYERFTFLCIPFTILYLYLILGSWMVKPFFNLKVLFSKYGKHLLSDHQKKSGISFLVLGLMTLTSFITFIILKKQLFLMIAFSLICTSITISRGFLIDIKNAKTFSYSLSIFFSLISCLAFFYPDKSLWFGVIIFVTFIAYTRNLNTIK